ncbi:MAG: type II secretion system protein [Limisphaerales bacterium]
MNSISGRCSKQGFTLVALLVIIAVLAILAAMLLPALARAKQKAQRINCVNNLKQDGLAFRLWEGDNGDKYPMAVSTNKNGTMEYGGDVFHHFQVMSNELSTPKILACPADNRTAAATFAGLKNQNVSYFVGLDATDVRPQMLLTGDRNVTNGLAPIRSVLELRPEIPAGWTAAMHNRQGNVGRVDGSVQQVTIDGLRHAIKHSDDATNRVALPE